MKTTQFSTKLVLAIGGLTAGALLIVGGILGLLDLRSANQQLQQRIDVECRLMAEAVSAAVAFNDSKTTADLLRSTMADPTVLLAAAFDEHGVLVADFRGPAFTGDTPKALGNVDATVGSTNSMAVNAVIKAGGEPVGTLVMVCDLRPLQARLIRQGLIAAGTVLVALLASMFAATRISRLLLGPIASLSAVAKRVARDGEYGIRAKKFQDDEVGLLTDALNGMLDHIQGQNDSLLRSNDDLERRVNERTSELERQAAALSAARDAAEAASRAKSDFLANMSHEIRTPMTAILGYADLLVDQGQSEEQRTDCIQTVRRNGEHLMSIINDILDISKIEAGAMTVECIEVDPIALLREAVDMMQVRARAKGLQLSATVSYPVPATIKSDPVRLRQILVNIIGNAIKFTEQGRVDVTLTAQPATSTLSVVVADSGIGMSGDQISRLFRPFSQADGTMARRFGGTGLGLAISQRLCEMLGGSVRVESQLGRGTVFTASIGTGTEAFQRLVTQEPAQSPAEPSANGRGAEHALNYRILLAEDGPDNQRLISFHLRKAGAAVDIAENGKFAIENIARANSEGNPYRLVLMDMQMPELDGYSATAQLREQACDLPIIELTAHAMAGDREKCLAAGCDDYMTKPVNRAQLVELCHKWISRGRSPQPANTQSLT